MQRVGFVLKIIPELKKEYKKAYYEVKPEMTKEAKDFGMHNYSIFLEKKEPFLHKYRYRNQEGHGAGTV